VTSLLLLAAGVAVVLALWRLAGRLNPVYVIAWLADAAAWLIGAFWQAGLISTGLLAVYAVSLVNPWITCRRCHGSDTRGWVGKAVHPGAHRTGCGSRFCYRGKRLRWGVRVLQPGRAAQLKDSQ
jgi:hypothetical protein